LAEDLRADYRIRGMKSLDRLELSISHLKGMFGGMRAMEITTARVKRYIDFRMEEGAANGTINRELAGLRKMFSLGAWCTPPKVVDPPRIPSLKEASPRTGFLEHAQYLAILEKLPEHYRGPVIFGYKTGWRQGEILGLTWANVDLEAGTVSLSKGTTKNDEGRIIYAGEELKDLLREAWNARKASGKLTPHVFPNKSRTNRIDKGRFNQAWKKACKNAGHPGKLFHDLRRTAARNMVRAGIPERVAMQITGHKTRSIFDRYNIVNDTDLRDAARRITEYHQEAENSGRRTPQRTPGGKETQNTQAQSVKKGA
ncbi:MAG: site-specific integrase, partial [Desulfobacteraceae bacterium]